VDDLKAEVSGLKDKLDNMETDMKDILSFSEDSMNNPY
jgi:hypothetical protein